MDGMAQTLGEFLNGFHVGDAVQFFDAHVNIFDGVKVWSGPFFDTHQLGIRLNFDVDVKILLNFDVPSSIVACLNNLHLGSASTK